MKSKAKALIQNDNFILTIPVGSVIYPKNGPKIILKEIPKEAQELWESGYYGLSLKKGSEALFASHTKEQIEKLIEIRKPLGYAVELQFLKSLLKPEKAKFAKPADKVE